MPQQIYNEMDIGWDNILLLDKPDHDSVQHVLQSSVSQTNDRLIGNIPVKEQRRRNGFALLLVLASLLVFALLLRFTLNTYGAALATPGQRSRAELQRLIAAWAIMAPALLAVLLFQYYPLGRGSLIAFQNYQILTGAHWVGLSNFGQVLFAQQFWQYLLNTLIFAGISLAMAVSRR